MHKSWDQIVNTHKMFYFIDHALMEIIFLPNKTAFNDHKDKRTI